MSGNPISNYPNRRLPQQSGNRTFVFWPWSGLYLTAFDSLKISLLSTFVQRSDPDLYHSTCPQALKRLYSYPFHFQLQMCLNLVSISFGTKYWLLGDYNLTFLFYRRIQDLPNFIYLLHVSLLMDIGKNSSSSPSQFPSD